MLIEQMPMLRIFFSKTGRAKYISHLDTMRMFSRAFRRSGLPVWYTQGFNPHLYMTFALPIALGYESRCESVDIRLIKPLPFTEVIQALNRALPPGFCATHAATPQHEPKAIARADYEVRLLYKEVPAQTVLRKLEEFLSLPVIEVEKKTKKGVSTVDIKPLTQALSAQATEDGVLLNLRCAAGITLNINPTLLLKAFYDWSDVLPDGVKILRAAILNEDLQAFA